MLDITKSTQDLVRDIQSKDFRPVEEKPLAALNSAPTKVIAPRVVLPSVKNDKIKLREFSQDTQDMAYATLNDGTKTARYKNYLPGTNNEERLAATQTTGEKLLNGFMKAQNTIATTVASGTIGSIYGIAKAVERGSFDAVYDNEFSNWLEKSNEKLRYELPNYYTQDEKEKGLGGQAGTANFWADKVLGGFAFTVGTLVSEGIWAAATGGSSLGTTAARMAAVGGRMGLKGAALTRLSESAAKVSNYKGWLQKGLDVTLKAGKADLKTAIKLGKIGDMANTVRFTWTSAGGEAGIEALQFKKEARDNFYSKNPNATSEEIDNFENNLSNGANAVFATNMAIVGASNLATMGSLLGIKSPISLGFDKFMSKRVLGITAEVTEDAGKISAKLAGATRGQKIARGLYTYGKAPVVEGLWEEGLQGVTNKVGQAWLENSYNPESTNKSFDLSGELYEALAHQYGTKEGWVENGVGMIIGALGGTANTMAEVRGMKNEAIFRASGENTYTEKSSKEAILMLNSIQAADKLESEAMSRGDLVTANRAKQEKLHAEMNYKHQLGEDVSDLVGKYEKILDNTTVEEFANVGVSEEEIEEYKEKVLEEYKESVNSFKTNREFAEYFIGKNQLRGKDVKSILSGQPKGFQDQETLIKALTYTLSMGEVAHKSMESIIGTISEVIGEENAKSIKLQQDLNLANKETVKKLQETNKQAKAAKEERKALQKELMKLQNAPKETEGNTVKGRRMGDIQVRLLELEEQIAELDTLRVNTANKAIDEANKRAGVSSKNLGVVSNFSSVSVEDLDQLDKNLSEINSIIESYKEVSPKTYDGLNQLIAEYKVAFKSFMDFQNTSLAITSGKLNLSNMTTGTKLERFLTKGKTLNDFSKDWLLDLLDSYQKAKTSTMAKEVEQTPQEEDSILITPTSVEEVPEAVLTEPIVEEPQPIPDSTITPQSTPKEIENPTIITDVLPTIATQEEQEVFEEVVANSLEEGQTADEFIQQEVQREIDGEESRAVGTEEKVSLFKVFIKKLAKLFTMFAIFWTSIAPTQGVLNSTGLVSIEKTQFIADIIKAPFQKVTESDFTEGQKQVMIDAIKVAESKGQNYVTYAEYQDASAVSRNKNATTGSKLVSSEIVGANDEVVVERTLGQFSFKKEGDKYIISDRYNFNSAKDYTFQEAIDHVKKGFEEGENYYLIIRRIADVFGSQESKNEGADVNVEIGEGKKEPPTSEASLGLLTALALIKRKNENGEEVTEEDVDNLKKELDKDSSNTIQFSVKQEANQIVQEANQPQNVKDIKARIKNIMESRYAFLSYIGQSYEDFLAARPTKEETEEYRELLKSNTKNKRFKELKLKLQNWRVLDSAVGEYSDLSIASLIEIANSLEQEPTLEEVETTFTLEDSLENEDNIKSVTDVVYNELTQNVNGLAYVIRDTEDNLVFSHIPIQEFIKAFNRNVEVVLQKRVLKNGKWVNSGNPITKPTRAEMEDFAKEEGTVFTIDGVIVEVGRGGTLKVKEDVLRKSNINLIPIESPDINWSYTVVYEKVDGKIKQKDSAFFDTEVDEELMFNLSEGELTADPITFSVSVNNEYNQKLIEKARKEIESTGKVSDKLKEEIKRTLNIHVVDKSGNKLSSLKADYKGFTSTEVDINFLLVREKAMEELVSRLESKETLSEIKLPILTKVSKVFLGSPVYNVEETENGTLVKKELDFTDETLGEVVSVGYALNGKLNVANKNIKIKKQFVDFKSRKNKNKKIPFIVFKKGNMYVAYPISLKTKNVDKLEGFLEIYNSEVSSGEKVVALNNFIKEELKMKPSDFGLTSLSQDKILDDIAEAAQNFVEVPNLESWLDNSFDKNILKDVATIDIDLLGKKIVSPKLKINLKGLLFYTTKQKYNEQMAELDKEMAVTLVNLYKMFRGSAIEGTRLSDFFDENPVDESNLGVWLQDANKRNTLISLFNFVNETTGEVKKKAIIGEARNLIGEAEISRIRAMISTYLRLKDSSVMIKDVDTVMEEELNKERTVEQIDERSELLQEYKNKREEIEKDLVSYIEDIFKDVKIVKYSLKKLPNFDGNFSSLSDSGKIESLKALLNSKNEDHIEYLQDNYSEVTVLAMKKSLDELDNTPQTLEELDKVIGKNC